MTGRSNPLPGFTGLGSAVLPALVSPQSVGLSAEWLPYTDRWSSTDVSSGASVSASRLQVTSSSTGVGGARGATPLTGKMFFLTTVFVLSSTTHMVGVANLSMNISANTPSDSTNGWGYYGNNGHKMNVTDVVYGDSWTLGDLIVTAVDVPNGCIWWSKNLTWQGSGNPLLALNPAFTNLVGPLYPWAGNITTNAGQQLIVPAVQATLGLQ